MTQGPWSVKGIDPKARSLARERAQRRGVTLGEYLNTLLLDEETGARIADVDVGPFSARQQTREAAPDELRRMSSEIDMLAQRLEASQSRNARSMSGVDKSILALMGKVDQSGKAQLTALERVTRAMGEIESTQSALRTRIDSLESDERGGATMDALKSLEGSLARLSEAVHERVGAIEENQESFRDLFDEKVSRVSDRVEGFARGLDDALNHAVRASSTGLTNRVDQIESQMSQVERRMEGALGRITDAASRFELFETKADRAVSDTTWRMERALEANMTRSRAMSKELLERVDSIEEKTREAVGALGDAVSRITDRLTRAERKQDTVASVLERSVTEIDERLARAGAGGESVAGIQAMFQKRLETLAEDLSRPMHAMRADVERRVEEALRAGVHPERMERLERSLRQFQDELQRSEARQAEMAQTLSAQAERLSRTVDERLGAVEARDDGRAVAAVRREMIALADTIDARLNGAETQARNAAGSVDGLRAEVSRLDATIADRFVDADLRTASLFEEMGGQVATVAERLQRRHEENVQKLLGKIEGQQAAGLGPADIDRLADRLDERVRDSERRSAEAIGQIGEQVARVADRLQTQHQESLRTLEARLAASDRTHESRLSEVLSDMSRRMDEIGEQATSALAPVHKTVSSIARRMAEIEDVTIGDGKAPRPREPETSFGIDVLDDDLVLLDDAPEHDNADAPDLAGPAADMLEEIDDVVGVDPPPFDRGHDAHLFDDKLEIHVGTGASLADVREVVPAGGEPARQIDDLLDMDDMVLASGKPGEFVGDLPSDDPRDRATLSYIAEARKAARQGRRVMTEAPQPAGRKGIGRGPLIASAALAVAVAGGGAWTVMRGKQDPGGDDFARLDPSAPEAQAVDADAAAAVLFPAEPGARNAGAGTLAIASVDPRNPAGADLFEETQPGAASVAGQTFQATAASVTPPPEAAITLAEAAASGDPVALHDHALELLQTGEKARAVTLLREASGKGLVMAQYRLAKLYEKGEGVPRDIAASRQWTEKAAIGGNSKAMHDLAVFYAEGDGGPQSYAAAVEWFRQASELGLVDSQYNLAVLYEQGLGVSQDKTEASYWFEVASRAGDTDATRRARTMLSELPPGEAEQIRRKARAFSPRQPIAKANGEFGKRAWEAATVAQISETQRLLERLGYGTGSTDGRPGAKTVEAIRQFERDNDLPVTGEPSISLLRRLRTAAQNTTG